MAGTIQFYLSMAGVCFCIWQPKYAHVGAAVFAAIALANLFI